MTIRNAMAPTPMGGKKATRHPHCSIRKPANKGPMKAVVGPTELQVPSAFPRSSGRKIVEINAIPNGMMPPTPTP